MVAFVLAIFLLPRIKPRLVMKVGMMVVISASLLLATMLTYTSDVLGPRRSLYSAGYIVPLL